MEEAVAASSLERNPPRRPDEQGGRGDPCRSRWCTCAGPG